MSPILVKMGILWKRLRELQKPNIGDDTSWPMLNIATIKPRNPVLAVSSILKINNLKVHIFFYVKKVYG